MKTHKKSHENDVQKSASQKNATTSCPNLDTFDMFEFEPFVSDKVEDPLKTPDTDEYHSHWESEEDIGNAVSYSPPIKLSSEEVNRSWESEDDSVKQSSSKYRSKDSKCGGYKSPERTSGRSTSKNCKGFKDDDIYSRSLEMPFNIRHTDRRSLSKRGGRFDGFEKEMSHPIDNFKTYVEDSWERGEDLNFEGEMLKFQRETLSQERKMLEEEKRKLAEKMVRYSIELNKNEQKYQSRDNKYSHRQRSRSKEAKRRGDQYSKEMHDSKRRRSVNKNDWFLDNDFCNTRKAKENQIDTYKGENKGRRESENVKDHKEDICAAEYLHEDKNDHNEKIDETNMNSDLEKCDGTRESVDNKMEQVSVVQENSKDYSEKFTTNSNSCKEENESCNVDEYQSTPKRGSIESKLRESSISPVGKINDVVLDNDVKEVEKFPGEKVNNLEHEYEEFMRIVAVDTSISDEKNSMPRRDVMESKDITPEPAKKSEKKKEKSKKKSQKVRARKKARKYVSSSSSTSSTESSDSESSSSSSYSSSTESSTSSTSSESDEKYVKKKKGTKGKIKKQKKRKRECKTKHAIIKNVDEMTYSASDADITIKKEKDVPEDMFNIPTLSQVNFIPLPVPSPDGTFICDSITEPVIIKQEKVDVEQDMVSPEKKLFFSPMKFIIPPRRNLMRNINDEKQNVNLPAMVGSDEEEREELKTISRPKLYLEEIYEKTKAENTTSPSKLSMEAFYENLKDERKELETISPKKLSMGDLYENSKERKRELNTISPKKLSVKTFYQTSKEDVKELNATPPKNLSVEAMYENSMDNLNKNANLSVVDESIFNIEGISQYKSTYTDQTSSKNKEPNLTEQTNIPNISVVNFDQDMYSQTVASKGKAVNADGVDNMYSEIKKSSMSPKRSPKRWSSRKKSSPKRTSSSKRNRNSPPHSRRYRSPSRYKDGSPKRYSPRHRDSSPYCRERSHDSSSGYKDVHQRNGDILPISRRSSSRIESPRRRISQRSRDYSSRNRKRRRSPTTRRRRRSYSISPLPERKKESIKMTLQRLAGIEDYVRPKSPINSPLDGFRRSLADSTISDDQLLQQNAKEYSESPSYGSILFDKSLRPGEISTSPKRISLDDRINQVLGLENEIPTSQLENDVHPSEISYTHVYNYNEQYNEHCGTYMQYESLSLKVPFCHYDTSYQEQNQNFSKVVQIGNVLQVVPTEQLMSPVQVTQVIG